MDVGPVPCGQREEVEVSQASSPGVGRSIDIGHDDYSLSRVPGSERYSWVTLAVQRFGQLSALSQFLLGATLGFGMTFWNAFLALTLGAVLLEVVADRKSTRLNSSHANISYAVFCLKKK